MGRHHPYDDGPHSARPRWTPLDYVELAAKIVLTPIWIAVVLFGLLWFWGGIILALLAL